MLEKNRPGRTSSWTSSMKEKLKGLLKNRQEVCQRRLAANLTSIKKPYFYKSRTGVIMDKEKWVCFDDDNMTGSARYFTND